MPRAQQNHVALAVGNQQQAPQNERAHKNLAQVRVPRHQALKTFRTEFQKLPGFGHASPHQRPAARDHGHFAGESSRLVGHDQAFAVQAGLHNLHASRKQHEERYAHVARLKQNLSRLHLAHLAEGTDAMDMLRRKGGKSVDAINRS